MKISVIDFPEYGLELKGEVPAKDYDLPTEGHLDWNTIEYDLRVDRTGNEFLVTGRIDTSLTLPCSRCMEPIPWKIEIDSYTISFPAEGTQAIDLTPSIREDILLSLPIAPGCKLDRDERCSISGVLHKRNADDFIESHQKSVWDALENIKTKE